jgi:hypothetical protein
VAPAELALPPREAHGTHATSPVEASNICEKAASHTQALTPSKAAFASLHAQSPPLAVAPPAQARQRSSAPERPFE